jgi:hypothetical protein
VAKGSNVVMLLSTIVFFDTPGSTESREWPSEWRECFTQQIDGAVLPACAPRGLPDAKTPRRKSAAQNRVKYFL